ncbi:MAG: 2-hydroxyacyl-CoA dehydratase [Candidatus Aureabacteria bacterium]|nr:2-hydroxyacyl-CoA dehydratase [Candidatus Auribacterota bacterium]
MGSCCKKKRNPSKKSRKPPKTKTPHVIKWFEDMVDHAYDFAVAEKKKGKKIVGIMCEYTPREIIMAAGGIPVCLCGGSLETITAAAETLPANLCPLIKSTFGYSMRKENPFLEMSDLLVAETTCDGKKKMYELLSERHPMHVLELPQKCNDADAYEHWIRELRKLIMKLEHLFSIDITDDKLRQAISLMNKERDLKRRLAFLMKSDSPPLSGVELLNMKSLISCMSEDFFQFERAVADLPGRKLSPPAEKRVRVLLTGVPLPHGAERVMQIIEDSGGLVVCQENCTGLKPILENVTENPSDPLIAIAQKYFHLPCSVMTKNKRRPEILNELISDYKPDCVIELIWQACLTYDVESALIKRIADEKCGLPYLKIETDYAPSDSARITLRVKTLFEKIKNKVNEAR